MKNTVMVTGLTPRDFTERKNFLTASDIPRIMGTSPWGTAFDVWLEKSEEKLGITLEPTEQSEAMLWGAMLEDDIVLYTQIQLRKHLGIPDLKATRAGIRRRHANGIMSATLDARIEGRPEAIEAKTHASIHPNIDLSEWGDEWTDAVPPAILDQALAQLACSPDLDRIWVVLSVARLKPSIYCVERRDHLLRIAAIEQAACDLWDNHILTGIPPAGDPTLATIKRVHAPIDPNQIATLDDQKIERFKRIKTAISKLQKLLEPIDASIRADLIGKALGRSPKGHNVRITTVHTQGYTVEPNTYQRMNVTLAVRN